ncbi:hypothetical protein KZ483_23385 [Paenibacillus sp. sptzw28]|uniref:hypothetical protein n=1 Tax=Paenibacillus sp. sptzw28 TaxID=715179 RepID=UPI001C6E60C7|nr:hypothetical protein [Paenibacillus sp. sptzw28]QYR20696.1 hypothetical protein KZ483_23385 [Paenibacillus sp. sptzw28]
MENWEEGLRPTMTRQSGAAYPAAGETLIERFKRYYGYYRQTSDVDISFISAYQALLLSLLDQVSRCADDGDLDAIRNLMREIDEIRHSIQGSNDSVKERFETEYRDSHPVS